MACAMASRLRPLLPRSKIHRITKLSKLRLFPTMTLSWPWNVSWCFVWRAFCGGFAARESNKYEQHLLSRENLGEVADLAERRRQVLGAAKQSDIAEANERQF